MIRSWLLLLALTVTGAAADQRPVLSLVIDDLGYSLENGLAAIDLDGDHTYAILPGAAYSRRLAEHAHGNNKEVILHLPMQSISSRTAHEPNALNEAMDEDQLTANVHSLLDQIPFIRGVNNHMGSHLTEFDFFMRPVMDSIRSYNPQLYFLDSRTSPRSVAHAQALESGLNSVSRDIFLDNETNLESIRLQYNIWLTKARERGSAIAIGHPFPNTLQVLRENLTAAHFDFRFLRVSRLIDERKNRPASTTVQQQHSRLPMPRPL
ncbi:MAG: divergent polysaccharide deacetylase family protein [Gammaproteobacteria bacterium]|nr:MAG: divergent polysaccharide deacetylase family protein [Gammaproteobacteria bacterium]UCH41811.1 MAG: divergent polysaccharide deacetylase family protein [Gammaproteobacteria bacterium]